MKVCYKCKIEKPIDEFGRCAKNKDGHSGWCKKCYAEYHRDWSKNSDKKRIEDAYLVLNGACREDYEQMFEFLKRCGYNPEQDIAKQFSEKYGLKYKPRRRRDINAFTYQELKKPPI